MNANIRKWIFAAALAGALALGTGGLARAQNPTEPSPSSNVQQLGASRARGAGDKAKLHRDRPRAKRPKKERADEHHAAPKRHRRRHHQQ